MNKITQWCCELLSIRRNSDSSCILTEETKTNKYTQTLDRPPPTLFNFPTDYFSSLVHHSGLALMIGLTTFTATTNRVQYVITQPRFLPHRAKWNSIQQSWDKLTPIINYCFKANPHWFFLSVWLLLSIDSIFP